MDLDDPGCLVPYQIREETACQNGGDDDFDGLRDFDGGQSIHGACTPGPFGCPPAVSDPDHDGIADPDPECQGRPWSNSEETAPFDCGLGFELAFLLPVWAWCSGRRRRGAA